MAYGTSVLRPCGFSKKVEHLARAVSLHFVHYNFARPYSSATASGRQQWRQTLRITSGRLRRS